MQKFLVKESQMLRKMMEKLLKKPRPIQGWCATDDDEGKM
jgi:hypothetical protein